MATQLKDIDVVMVPSQPKVQLTLIITAAQIRKEHTDDLNGNDPAARERARCREDCALNASSYFNKGTFEEVLEGMFQTMAESRNAALP